ncbi:hypothetical protein TrLO_g1794 [Triparma laevis f. longispina]|uniref:Uncharacterized protein n=2 Tax=Triparma laevis TaxID=1534972 RepID=A0A9W7AEY4_9STRA|nr:hypothetical protein TrLO_g1794 [Triparma laevis f. longispina]
MISIPSLSSSFRMATTRMSTTRVFSLRGGVVDPSADYVIENVGKSGERLKKVRKEMKARNYDIYLLPSSDSHLSEYSSPHDSLRTYLTSFTGSAGTALVGSEEKKKAKFWTDGRYWLQAGGEVDGELWEVMKDGHPSTPSIPTHISHLQSLSPHPLTLGLDPNLFPSSFITLIKTASPTTILSYDKSNLIGDVWEDRPMSPRSVWREHPIEYAGKNVGEKVEVIREKMKEKKAYATVYSDLSEVSYILNLRGSDISCCPVCKSYCIITTNEIRLYCEEYKTKGVEEYLRGFGVKVRPYESVGEDIGGLGKEAEERGEKIWLDTTKAAYGLTLGIPESALLETSPNPVEDLKSVKNEAEMEGMKLAHRVDGVAVARFASWCEDELKANKPVTEIDVDEKLLHYRSLSPSFIEPSFPTIAGVSSNGAIIHYRASPTSSKTLTSKNPILIDSGGQYTMGTTDATRTWSFGPPTPHFSTQFTLVLKGHISLSTQTFPPSTPGAFLDTLARMHLWQKGYNYAHGTGHGVGASLNVHEGPASISPRLGNSNVLKEGMVMSNEPGYYEEGEFGIRIENLLAVVTKEVKSGEDGWLGFEYLTMIPIQRHLIDLELLKEEEVEWINEYHEMVWEEVSALMEEGEKAKEWLWENTRPL